VTLRDFFHINRFKAQIRLPKTADIAVYLLLFGKNFYRLKQDIYFSQSDHFFVNVGK
jgi:hypothetical protein